MISEKKTTIIVTLLIDNESQSFFDQKRKQYFPAFANFTKAHITLFHCLPNNEIIFNKIAELAKNTSSFKIDVANIINNKNFNAYQLQSNELNNVHAKLQQTFKSYLSKKDIKTIKPHITIQNKTTAFKAKKNYDEIMKTFIPFPINALGITCWSYSKKIWGKKEDFYFEK